LIEDGEVVKGIEREIVNLERKILANVFVNIFIEEWLG